MKPKIHPEYGECQVACGCGVKFTTRSTRKEIHIEVCSACHPFYTGRQKFVDTAGRIEKFRRKYGKPAEAAVDPTGDEGETAATASSEAAG